MLGKHEISRFNSSWITDSVVNSNVCHSQFYNNVSNVTIQTYTNCACWSWLSGYISTIISIPGRICQADQTLILTDTMAQWLTWWSARTGGGNSPATPQYDVSGSISRHLHYYRAKALECALMMLVGCLCCLWDINIDIAPLMISLILSASPLMISSVNIDISATLPTPPPPPPPPTSDKYELRGTSVTKWSECCGGWCKAGEVDHFHTLPICYHDNLPVTVSSLTRRIMMTLYTSGQIIFNPATQSGQSSVLSPQSGKWIFYTLGSPLLSSHCSALTGLESFKNLRWCQDHFNLSRDKWINWSNMIRSWWGSFIMFQYGF